MFNKNLNVFVFFLLLFSGLVAASCSSITVSTSTTVSTATTGTNVVITGSMSPQSSCSDDVSFVSSGQSSGSSLTVSDPSSGQYQGASISSGTTKTFTVTAGVADQYSYNVRVGSSLSTPTGLITFINPSTLSVSGSVSDTTVATSDTFTYQVTVNNPSSSEVTTSYSLGYSSTYFSLSGDPTATTITIPAGSSSTLSWTVTVSSGAFSTSSITLGLGSNTNAFSSTITGSGSSSTPTPTPSTPPGSGAGSPTPTATPTTTTSSSGSDVSGGVRRPVAQPVPEGEVVIEEQQALPSQTLVAGDLGTVQLDLSRNLVVQKAEDGTTSSVFTLNVVNPYDSALKLKVVEKIPDSVATIGDYDSGLLQFSAPAPDRVKEGSVVAEWDSVVLKAGATTSLTYWVEKELSTSVLNDFAAPKLSVVSSGKTAKPSLVASVEAGSEQYGAGPVGGQDNTWLYLVLGVVILAGLYLLVIKKRD